jgi:membrane-bound lytic murein transglycosylase D
MAPAHYCIATLLLAWAGAAMAGPSGPPAEAVPVAASVPGNAPPDVRSGREIYAEFRAGLANPVCDADTSTRWSKHFAHVPKQLAHGPGDVLQLFGYVVDALREAGLPTEYALIPFVESGYKPGARSASGPAGLWQFIAVTARNHKVPIRPGYDGRLSPVDATRAAVRYLKTLHGMFAGDWRLTVMAFNAGEYRVLGALRRHGQKAMDAKPTELTSLAGITQAYVRKLHALSCVLATADDREEWMRALEARHVPRLRAVDLPAGVDSIDAWAARQGFDVAAVRRLNPVFAGVQRPRVAAGSRVLVPDIAGDKAPDPAQAGVSAAGLAAGSARSAVPATPAEPRVAATREAGEPSDAGPGQRTHTVAPGESAWLIARRHGIGVDELLARNGLGPRSVLRPGMVLLLAESTAEAAAAASAVAN